MRRAALAAGAALALLWGAAGEVWAFGFSVDPARVQVSVPAGKRRGQTLTVKNAKPDTAIHLTIYVRDVVYLPDGTNEFPPTGSTAWSCADWIQVTPMELDIPANSSRDVRVSVTAPSEAEGGRYAVIFFETGPSYGEEGIAINFRVGALVEAVVPGTQHAEATLNDLAFQAPGTLRVDVFNHGNLLIRPRGHVKIFDAQGKKIRQTDINPHLVGILPKTLRSFSAELTPLLAPGSYRMKTEIDYGARTLLVGERAIELP